MCYAPCNAVKARSNIATGWSKMLQNAVIHRDSMLFKVWPTFSCQLHRIVHNMQYAYDDGVSDHLAESGQLVLETSQELQMLSSVTINCQVTKIVMNSGSQLSEL